MNGQSSHNTHTHSHTHTHRYNKIFSSSKQKKETLQFAATWLDFEDIVLSKRKTVTVWSYMWSPNKQYWTHRRDWWLTEVGKIGEGGQNVETLTCKNIIPRI